MSAYLANLNRLPAWLHAYGVTHIVACPGSRNAPLLETLHRSGLFTITGVRDERSAAFIALGMAQRGIPAAICCTSGTAVLNLYSAVCEAYYQRVPLIAITADRPPELIDQWDGQTIRQQGIFEKHILDSIQWPDDLDDPEQSGVIDALMERALQQATGPCKGPIHINIPLRDPIYRDFEHLSPIVPVCAKKAANTGSHEILLPELTGRTLLICGMHAPDERLQKAIKRISAKMPVLCDIASGLLEYSSHPNWERSFLMSGGELPEVLAADQLISIGTSMLSKPLKQWLRRQKPKKQFHISEAGWVGDPFDTHPRNLSQNPAAFLELLDEQLVPNANYQAAWNQWFATHEERYRQIQPILPWSEWSALELLFKTMPQGTTLQLGNSMPVRYAAWLAPQNVNAVFSNRGSSGIDGCVSTAVGYALAHPKEQVLLLVGDVSFFYDSNALWIDHQPENLRIVILNNQGGNIFRIIDGPNKLQVTRSFLVMEEFRSAQTLANSYSCAYYPMHEAPHPDELHQFFSQKGPAILELVFPANSGPEVLARIKGA
ncbi:MAG: 2-succinyl-5-enolpyruvyl-6-hydroxy-3-cyclohexene-carboxylic-acid synthase [Bacteroidota bacterium]|jgi:2-succinyl-5-enolpyruvyl-6-hydroxy-3-cyclohexene-1-carboxylate synthase